MGDKKAAYNGAPPAPPPSRPSTSPTSASRQRQSIDRRRRSTSLDPLPPIEEPPDLPPVPDPSHSDSFGLEPIYSLHNPRPHSRRNPPDHQRPSSQHQSSTDPPTLDQHLSASRGPAPNPYTTPSDPPPPFPSEEFSIGPRTTSTPQEMHVSSPSSASSISLQKPPIIVPEPSLQVKNPKPSQPRVAYFHGGIGGRGNYRKVVRENHRAPLAHARNVSPPGGRSSRFLSNLFGAGRRRRSSPSGENGASANASARQSEDSLGSNEKEEVELGAAEVMRRKLLRQAGVKPKSKNNVGGSDAS